LILSDIIALVDAEVVVGADKMDTEITTACGADLMSDVLAYIHPSSLLFSGLANPQVVRTAEMVDAAAIVLVRGKIPSPDTVALAAEREIPLLRSPYTMFECCGRLYAAGVESCDVRGVERERAENRIREFTQRKASTTRSQP
jgi:predicted transcriptional regulator